MFKKSFKYELETPAGKIELIKGERYHEVIETINMAVQGNTKVLNLITTNSNFADLLDIVNVLKASGGEIRIVSKSELLLADQAHHLNILNL